MGLMILSAGIIAYLLGSINTSIIISRLLGSDIRKSGSGNAGATNSLRTYGKKVAALVVGGDALKGVIAILIAKFLGNIFEAPRPELLYYISAVCVILGHNFPIYFGFKGGKGILTSTAVVFMLDWRIGLIIFTVSVIIIAVTRYVSLGSCIGSVLFIAMVILFHTRDIYFILLSIVMCILAIFMHRDNIKRLLNGTERKIGRKA